MEMCVCRHEKEAKKEATATAVEKRRHEKEVKKEAIANCNSFRVTVPARVGEGEESDHQSAGPTRGEGGCRCESGRGASPERCGKTRGYC